MLILKAFDLNGCEITSGNGNAVSIGFNVVVEKEQLESCQAEIEGGVLRLTKKF